MQFVLDFVRAYPGVVVLALLVAAVTAWHVWQFRLQPLRTPRAEIEAIATRLIAEHGSRAEEAAYGEEDRAWYDGNVLEQGKWRRVRRELWRRYERGEWE